MTIREAFNLFIQDKKIYCAPATILKYISDTDSFLKFIGKEVEIDIDKNYYKEYILYLRSCGTRSVTIRSYCRSLRTFFRWCYERDLCRDYLKGINLPRDDSNIKMPLLQDEVLQIDATFDLFTLAGMRNYCIFHLMLDCGLRRQEVINLKVDDLIADRNILQIRCSKGNKSRFVLIPDFLIEKIKSYQAMLCIRSGVLFRNLKHPEASLSADCIKKVFQDLKKVTGLDRIHAHLLRHTFATSFLIGGGNLEFLRVFLGHSSYNVTQVYSKMAAEYKILGLEVYKLDPIFFKFGY